MEFKKRLLDVMSHYGHNKNSFSHAIGASNNTIIGRLVNETGRRPSFEILSMILKAFPAINPSWLILGVGDMFVQRQSQIKKVSDRIALLCEVLHITHGHLSEISGISLPELNSIFRGDREPTDRQLSSIALALPAVNQEWLIRGEGDMLVAGLSLKDFITYFDSLPAGSTQDVVSKMTGVFTLYSSKMSQLGPGFKFGIRIQAIDFAPAMTVGDYATVVCTTVYDVLPSDIVFISTSRRNMIRRLLKPVNTDDAVITVADGNSIEHDIPVSDITMIGLVRSIFRTIS